MHIRVRESGLNLALTPEIVQAAGFHLVHLNAAVIWHRYSRERRI